MRGGKRRGAGRETVAIQVSFTINWPEFSIRRFDRSTERSSTVCVFNDLEIAMRPLKPIFLAALCAAFAGPALADAAMVDVKEKMYDADYEVIIAQFGYTVGTDVYGAHDADYDVLLSDAGMFKPLLGYYDADYEAVLMPASEFAGTTVALR